MSQLSITTAKATSGVRRSKAVATDAQMVHFLYMILKQLDLKSVSIHLSSLDRRNPLTDTMTDRLEFGCLTDGDLQRTRRANAILSFSPADGGESLSYTPHKAKEGNKHQGRQVWRKQVHQDC